MIMCKKRLVRYFPPVSPTFVRNFRTMRFRKALLIVNGISRELQPNRANTFDEVYADFQHQSENGEHYSIFLHPKQDITVQRLELHFDLSLPAAARFFANGYQSWSESRWHSPDSHIPRLRRIARCRLGFYGDEHIAGIPRGRGQLHSWTYALVRYPAAGVLLMGSVNERTGFTLFLYDHASGTLTVRKDLDQLSLRHSFPALELWFQQGEEAAMFDAYFDKWEIKASAAPPVLGWTSWYAHFNQITEALLLEKLEAFSAEPLFKAPGTVFQIDDGWQTEIGDWLSAKPVFPGGMRVLATKIREKGLQPGLWLAPFVVSPRSELARRHPEWLLRDAKGLPVRAGWNPMWGSWYHALDFYHEGVREYLSGVFHMVLEKWGYNLLKLDFLFAVALAPPPGKTRGGVMWEAMEFLRQQSGTARILACGVPLGAAFGLADYCRISGDVHTAWRHPLLGFLHHRERVDTLAALRSTLGRWRLNGRAFHNDPDVFILRTEGQKLSPTQQHTLLTINALLGNILFTSDDPSVYTPEQYVELAEALAWRGSQIREVTELANDVWKIDFEHEGRRWTAYCNLNSEEKNIPSTNGAGVELRPYETLVLLAG